MLISIVLSFEHPQKAFWPIWITLDGIVNDSNEEQSAKALKPMKYKSEFLRKIIYLRFKHFWKEWSPIILTDFGIIISSIDIKEKAPCSINFKLESSENTTFLSILQFWKVHESIFWIKDGITANLLFLLAKNRI